METDGFTKGGGTTDLEAVKLWKSYPDEMKEIWFHNAFCINCGKYHLSRDIVCGKINLAW